MAFLSLPAKILFGNSKSDSTEKYSRVASEDDSENNLASESQEFLTPFSKQHNSRSGVYLRKYATIITTILLTLLVTILSGLLATIILTKAFNVSFTITAPSPKILVSPCGNTAEEARTRGCHFDLISFCWLPDACYDAELSDSFDNITKWEWFLDQNKTQSITHEQAMTGEYTGLYVNWEYHLRHCTAMWKKLHRAVLGKGKGAIDGYLGRPDHTKHCEHMLLSDRERALDEMNTKILVKFPDCGIE